MITIVAIWVQAVLLDTSHFVTATNALIQDPAVQESIANRTTEALFTAANPEGRIRDALPDRAEFLASTLSDNLQRFVHDRVLELVRSPSFAETWGNLITTAHQTTVALLRGQQVRSVTAQNGVVTLDLRPVTASALQALDKRGITIFDGLQISGDQAQLVLVQSPILAQLQSAIAMLDKLARWLPALTILALTGSVLLARTLFAGFLRAGIGVAISMVILLLLLSIVRGEYLSAISGVSTQAAATFFDALATPMQMFAGLMLGAGAIVAVVAVIVEVARRELVDAVRHQRCEHDRARLCLTAGSHFRSVGSRLRPRSQPMRLGPLPYRPPNQPRNVPPAG
jgi:hypothetical protein